MRVLSIDPGNEYSGYTLIDETYKPLMFGKVKNTELEAMLQSNTLKLHRGDRIIIEMVASYGMAVGRTVFETCVWIGRFTEASIICLKIRPQYVTRKQYVTELCGTAKAKDSNVIQYLIDRFAYDTPNRGKGSKNNQGWFFGFKADIWQAYAIAVWLMERELGDTNYD